MLQYFYFIESFHIYSYCIQNKVVGHQHSEKDKPRLPLSGTMSGENTCTCVCSPGQQKQLSGGSCSCFQEGEETRSSNTDKLWGFDSATDGAVKIVFTLVS